MDFVFVSAGKVSSANFVQIRRKIKWAVISSIIAVVIVAEADRAIGTAEQVATIHRSSIVAAVSIGPRRQGEENSRSAMDGNSSRQKLASRWPFRT